MVKALAETGSTARFNSYEMINGGQHRQEALTVPFESWRDLAKAKIFPTAAEFDSVHGDGAWVGYLEWVEEGVIKRETEIREFLPDLSTQR